jgi:hypothetical protein
VTKVLDDEMGEDCGTHERRKQLVKGFSKETLNKGAAFKT